MDHHYDIAIIGLGCAGGHLTLQLIEAQLDLKVVVIDPWSSEKPNKAWSFWEQGAGKWDHLIEKTWSKTIVKTKDKSLTLDLDPYIYKSLDSKKFTAFAKARLEQSSSFTFIDESVTEIEQAKNLLKIKLSDGQEITAKNVLDSRIPEEFYQDTEAITLKQHFKGIVIETDEPAFDPDTCTMMDYSLMDPGTCSFTYVLPYSEHRALVEFTYFSHEVVEENVYDQYIHQYIAEQLNIAYFKVLETETGVVPMTTHDFTKYSSKSHLKVGTGGGWVKPSTGYSFKMCEKKSRQVVQNLNSGKALGHNLFNVKASLYDATLLDVLDKNNGKGDQVFFKLYSSNKMSFFFKFLDEETTFLQDVRIMLPMTSMAFLKPFFKNLPKIFWSR